MAIGHTQRTLDYLLPIAQKLAKVITPPADLMENPSKVYTPGDEAARAVLSRDILRHLALPGSAIRGVEHLQELYRRAQAGQSCIIMMEHYGNFDLPGLTHLLLQMGEEGGKIANSLLAIQAIKLTASGGNHLTSAFASCYSTITIYPSRHIDQIVDEQEKQRVRKISNPINHAAMRELTRHKYQGRILLMFPAGTRYRPWNPDTKRGVREIRSYLKVFHNVVFIGINGNLLLPSRDEKMEHDMLRRDVLLYNVSPVVNARNFLQQVKQESSCDDDVKKIIAERVMKELEQLHQDGEPVYDKLVAQLEQPPTTWFPPHTEENTLA